MKKTSTFGMNIVEPSRYATLSSQFEQLEIDFVRGNKKLSDVQQAISTWKSSVYFARRRRAGEES